MIYTDSHKNSQLIFDKGAKDAVERRQSFQQMMVEYLDILLQNNDSRYSAYTLHKY